MDHFEYRNGRLFADGVDIERIAESVGTPTYVYAAETLREHYRRLVDAFAPLDPLICYSIKSSPNLAIIGVLHELGAGMDVVSGGELHRAIEAGVDPARCVFAGVGKTDEEIRYALRAGLGWFNCESEPEFENIARIAAEEGIEARVALRVNPDVDPKTHRYTTTGTRETKFGVDIERARRFFTTYGATPNVRLAGIHLHIGSPVYTTDPYRRSIERALALIDELESDGHAIELLDLGGGYGADYESGQSPDARAYAAVIIPMLEARVRAGLKIVLEPGRSIAANAGVLVTRVQYVKHSGDVASGERRFVIADAGMHTLLRPSHYEAFHFIWPTAPAAAHVPVARTEHPELPDLSPADVVGPICETGDFLARDRALPPVSRGDLLAVFTAGAYGISMASRYNSMPLPAEVLVDGDAFEVIRTRETFEDLVAHERRPTTARHGEPATTRSAT